MRRVPSMIYVSDLPNTTRTFVPLHHASNNTLQKHVITTREIGPSKSGSNATILVDGIEVTSLPLLGSDHPAAGACHFMMHDNDESLPNTALFGPGKLHGRTGQHEIEFLVNAGGKILEFSSIIVI